MKTDRQIVSQVKLALDDLKSEFVSNSSQDNEIKYEVFVERVDQAMQPLQQMEYASWRQRKAKES